MVMKNRIEEIHPGIGDLHALSFVEFSHNRLQRIPMSFQNLKRLSGLGLSDNLFTEFPGQLCFLTNLTQLGFHTNNLSSIPEEISNLVKLKKLDISKNRLQSIPESFGSLVNLEWLNLGHNSINSLPNSLTGLAKLSDIGLAHNQLDSICWCRGMTGLKSLIIYDNKFSSLDSEVLKTLQGLQVLEASQNELRTFPVELLELPRIQKINLQRNRIRDVSSNFNFKCAQTLNTILLQHNLIEIFPKEFMPIVEMLENFAIEGNPLVQTQFPFTKCCISLKEIALNEMLIGYQENDKIGERIPIACMNVYSKKQKCECCKRTCVHTMQRFVVFLTYKLPNGRATQRIPFQFFVCSMTEMFRMVKSRILFEVIPINA